MISIKNYVKNTGSIFASAFSILGCVLGAGFLSGAEITSFFVRFGYYGIVGAILCAVIFGVVAYAVCKHGARINPIEPKCSSHNGWLAAKDWLMPVCQLIIAATMVAGSVQILVDFGCPLWACQIVVFLALFFALALGLKFANFVNFCVTACAIFLLVVVLSGADVWHNGLSALRQQVNFFSCGAAIIFASLYAIMNIISSYTIIINIAKQGSKKCRKICMLSGLILGGLVLTIFCALAANDIAKSMPLLQLIKSPVVHILYSILLVVAMASTMLSCGLGTKMWLNNRWGNWGSSFVSAALACIISFVGFGRLVAIGYPVIAILYIAKFVVILVKSGKTKAKKARI